MSWKATPQLPRSFSTVPTSGARRFLFSLYEISLSSFGFLDSSAKGKGGAEEKRAAEEKEP
jgi:hypothetical protein